MISLPDIPKNPGCYLFKDKSSNIIYIGKAKSLRKRVSSYFQKKEHDPKTALMISNIASVDFIATSNEIEALILENNLIKKHKPRYNIDLRDSKQYAYIRITKEKFPRIVIARKKSDDGMFFGPFVSASERDYVIELIKKTFRLRTCKNFPKKPCLRYHIKLCDAPCIGIISKEDYNKRIENAIWLLKGNTDELIKKLKADMKGYSDTKNFEKAIELREQIRSIENLDERQKMQRQKKYDEDIIGYIVKENKVYLLLFKIYRGILAEKNQFIFDYTKDFLEDFLVQYYSEEDIPKEIIVQEEVESAVSGYLSQLKGSKVMVTVPKIGEKKQLLELVRKNVELSFFGNMTKLEHLKNRLSLEELPNIIECFDISHLSGTSTTGSMVQFRNGKPDKSNYRRFKIRTVEGIDDFASIAEIVRRRYKRLIDENAELPKLIIIDGGKGQLNYAVDALQKLGIRIPIISIAKRLEEIYMPGKDMPITLNRKDKALLFIQEVRDEAHRFAIKYNRLLRSKSVRS